MNLQFYFYIYKNQSITVGKRRLPTYINNIYYIYNIHILIHKVIFVLFLQNSFSYPTGGLVYRIIFM